jgi:hypothetical protein
MERIYHVVCTYKILTEVQFGWSHKTTLQLDIHLDYPCCTMTFTSLKVDEVGQHRVRLLHHSPLPGLLHRRHVAHICYIPIQTW